MMDQLTRQHSWIFAAGCGAGGAMVASLFDASYGVRTLSALFAAYAAFNWFRDAHTKPRE